MSTVLDSTTEPPPPNQPGAARSLAFVTLRQPGREHLPPLSVETEEGPGLVPPDYVAPSPFPQVGSKPLKPSVGALGRCAALLLVSEVTRYEGGYAQELPHGIWVLACLDEAERGHRHPIPTIRWRLSRRLTPHRADREFGMQLSHPTKILQDLRIGLGRAYDEVELCRRRIAELPRRVGFESQYGNVGEVARFGSCHAQSSQRSRVASIYRQGVQVSDVLARTAKETDPLFETFKNASLTSAKLVGMGIVFLVC